MPGGNSSASCAPAAVSPRAAAARRVTHAPRGRCRSARPAFSVRPLPLCAARILRAAAAALRGQGTEGEKPLWSRRRGVVPRRGRLSAGGRSARGPLAGVPLRGFCAFAHRFRRHTCLFCNTWWTARAGGARTGLVEHRKPRLTQRSSRGRLRRPGRKCCETRPTARAGAGHEPVRNVCALTRRFRRGACVFCNTSRSRARRPMRTASAKCRKPERIRGSSLARAPAGANMLRNTASGQRPEGRSRRGTTPRRRHPSGFSPQCPGHAEPRRPAGSGGGERSGCGRRRAAGASGKDRAQIRRSVPPEAGV